jgi:hypothetical protein
MIDLDKSRAARAEAKGIGPVVKIGGKDYQLAAEMPYSVLEAMAPLGETENSDAAAPGALTAIAQALLGEHYGVIAPQLSVDDLNELISGVMEEYGVSEGPLASTAS